MPEGSTQNQNQGSQGQVAASDFPSQESESPYTSQSQNNSSVDGINGTAHPVEELNLGPNQIAPNLAREGGYFEEHPNNVAPQGTASQSGSEMQYPSYNKESESFFNPKLIIIIIVVGIILLGSVFGIIYFFKSGSQSTSDTVDLTQDNSSRDNSTSDMTTTDQNNSDTNVSGTTSPPVTQTAPTTAPVEQPKIVVPQPTAPVPDNTDAVEGSG